MGVDEISDSYMKQNKVNHYKFWSEDTKGIILYETDYVEWLEQQLIKAREESENKSCCGNCKLYRYDHDWSEQYLCILGKTRKGSHMKGCSDWQFDGSTKQDREV